MQFKVHGQGIFLFNSPEFCSIKLYDKSKTSGLLIKLDETIKTFETNSV